MVLDVNEIILKKIKELEENKVIENAIEKKIESVVLQAIDCEDILYQCID